MVVLATPPFWFATAMVRVTPAIVPVLRRCRVTAPPVAFCACEHPAVPRPARRGGPGPGAGRPRRAGRAGRRPRRPARRAACRGLAGRARARLHRVQGGLHRGARAARRRRSPGGGPRPARAVRVARATATPRRTTSRRSPRTSSRWPARSGAPVHLARPLLRRARRPGGRAGRPGGAALADDHGLRDRRRSRTRRRATWS